MFKTEFLCLFLLLFSFQRIVLGKSKIDHKLRVKQGKIKEKCSPSRCNLICPIELPAPFNMGIPESPIRLQKLFDDLDYYDEEEERYKRGRLPLTKRQKQQVKLGNRNGKKAYKFRQFSPSGCYVGCTDYQETQQIPATQTVPSNLSTSMSFAPTPPSISSNTISDGDDEEEEEDDPYRPGEDRPIEATFSPPEKRSHVSKSKGKFKAKKSRKHTSI